jgi:hypothetical protein
MNRGAEQSGAELPFGRACQIAACEQQQNHGRKSQAHDD